VLAQPPVDLRLELRTRVPELRELDQVLELEVVDVVDQGSDIIAAAAPSGAAS
jgi:hypothetical protein